MASGARGLSLSEVVQIVPLFLVFLGDVNFQCLWRTPFFDIWPRYF